MFFLVKKCSKGYTKVIIFLNIRICEKEAQAGQKSVAQRGLVAKARYFCFLGECKKEVAEGNHGITGNIFGEKFLII